MRQKRLVLGLLGALAVLAATIVLFACSQTPTPVPVRTFERAQKVDFVCLHFSREDIPGKAPVMHAEGRPVEECTPTPPNVDGATFANQLFALVTQSARGEVAVVNLSAGAILDLDSKTPNANFLPVGSVPTDIAAAPDGAMTFVASAAPNKPAIYALPSTRILGDKSIVRNVDAAGNTFDVALAADPQGTPTLASWPVCALPQAPAALTVVPRPNATGDQPKYELVAILPGDRTTSAKVVTIDPRPFLRGAGALPADAGAPVVGPGSLSSCVFTGATELAGEDLLPAEFRPGPKWSTGLPYADAGAIDLTCELPVQTGACGAPPCCLVPNVTTSDAGADGGTTTTTSPAVACETSTGDAGAPAIPLDVGPLDPPRAVAVARDEQILYVADEAVPFVHVLDLSTPGTLKERAPLVTTSTTDPSRPVVVRALSVSPSTRDYKKYLYAVDARIGSLMVFDVSAPSDAPRVPLTRPFPELNPFQPPDRIAFAAPVVAVEFARVDVPVVPNGSDTNVTGLTGALCNPNPTADPAVDPGVFYRANSSAPSAAFGDFGPKRLRGVFAFVTLANGTVAVVDVDDWDAPCRRPQILQALAATTPNPAGGDYPPFSSTARPEPDVAGDPYGAPLAVQDGTSDESFFPVSLPHRLRSAVLLRANTSSGKQIPYVTGTPLVDRKGVALATSGVGSEATPILKPTIERGAEPATIPGVRFSFEEPDVHVDQDWTVTYEGALPGFDGANATLATSDGYQSLDFRQPGGRFCSKGVEDWDLGRDRASTVTAFLSAAKRLDPAEPLDRRIADYVQITSDLLGPDDPYWTIGASTDAGSCWSGTTAAPGPARYDLCNATFGAPDDERPGRDFPILEAYDDRLVVGRFYNFQRTPGATREVVWKDPTNAPDLKLAQCCFHGQAKFRVRTGGMWSAVGSVFGFLHHTTTGDGGRCVTSCDPNEALRTSRAPGVPQGRGAAAPLVTRDSPLAMRNPVFSFFVENGVSGATDVAPLRDTAWHFTSRGQFQSLSLAYGGTSASVAPQSMRFIAPLGQVAIVDASAQGLVLVDLRTVSLARTPFF